MVRFIIVSMLVIIFQLPPLRNPLYNFEGTRSDVGKAYLQTSSPKISSDIVPYLQPAFIHNASLVLVQSIECEPERIGNDLIE